MLLLLACTGPPADPPLRREAPDCEGSDVFVEPVLDEVAVARAIRFWRALGFDVGELREWTSSDLPPAGFYVAVSPEFVADAERKLGYEVDAVTEVKRGREGTLCRVALRAPSRETRLFAHELGHGLGFPDVQTWGHVMFEASPGLGPDATGCVP